MRKEVAADNLEGGDGKACGRAESGGRRGEEESREKHRGRQRSRTRAPGRPSRPEEENTEDRPAFVARLQKAKSESVDWGAREQKRLGETRPREEEERRESEKRGGCERRCSAHPRRHARVRMCAYACVCVCCCRKERRGKDEEWRDKQRKGDRNCIQRRSRQVGTRAKRNQEHKRGEHLTRAVFGAARLQHVLRSKRQCCNDHFFRGGSCLLSASMAGWRLPCASEVRARVGGGGVRRRGRATRQLPGQGQMMKGVCRGKRRAEMEAAPSAPLHKHTESERSEERPNCGRERAEERGEGRGGFEAPLR